jgi:hypothetical protein
MASKNGTAHAVELDFGTGLPEKASISMGSEKRYVISTDFDPAIVARAGRWIAAWARHVNENGPRPSNEELHSISADVLGIDLEEASGYQFAAHFKLASFLQKPFDMTGVMSKFLRTPSGSSSPTAED